MLINFYFWVLFLLFFFLMLDSYWDAKILDGMRFFNNMKQNPIFCSSDQLKILNETEL